MVGGENVLTLHALILPYWTVTQTLAGLSIKYILTIHFFISVSLNHAYPKLASYRPPAQLISPQLLLSVVLNIIFSLALQICGFLIVQDQLWYSSSDIFR